VAEAILKKLKPEMEVDSAGTNPRVPHKIAEEATEYLESRNTEKFLKKKPQGLSEKDLANYDLIIVMKNEHRKVVLNKCPECENKVLTWNVDDPYFLPKNYTEKIFEQIRRKVEKLSHSLQ
jgi:protein-tyrosine-phosphatase